jgi:Tfp pilus assembly protein PilF
MQYDRVPVAWRAVLADPAAAAELRARTAVHLAGFLVHSGTDVPGGRHLLEEQAPDERLSAVDRRLKTIFRADALVLQGQREAAVDCYCQAGNAVANNDTDYEVRRRGRIENARDYLRRKEYDAAEEVVRGLEWERPLERLELETGMLMAEVHRGRGEQLLALGVCRRLLAAAPAGPRRSDLLLVTAQLCRELKRDSDCRALLAQLWKDHPYSEAAALAKDRFPERAGGR